jgi:hypothetical protein
MQPLCFIPITFWEIIWYCTWKVPYFTNGTINIYQCYFFCFSKKINQKKKPEKEPLRAFSVAQQQHMLTLRVVSAPVAFGGIRYYTLRDVSAASSATDGHPEVWIWRICNPLIRKAKAQRAFGCSVGLAALAPNAVFSIKLFSMQDNNRTAYSIS